MPLSHTAESDGAANPRIVLNSIGVQALMCILRKMWQNKERVEWTQMKLSLFVQFLKRYSLNVQPLASKSVRPCNHHLNGLITIGCKL